MRDLFNYGYVIKRDRLAWIDYARGICIILVCYRHSFEGLINAHFPTGNYPFLELINSTLVTFRMALFFMLSGSFISGTLLKKNYGEYVSDRFKLILYPMLIWGAVQITLQLVFKDVTNAKREPIDYLNLLLMPRRIEQFWYLNTLFMVGVVYAFFKSVLRFSLWQLMITAILLYALGGLYYSTNMNMRYETLAYSFIPDLLHYYIFFFIGDAISSFILNRENTKYMNSTRLLIPGLTLFLITHYFYTTINDMHHLGYYVEFYMPVFFLLVALSGAVFTIQLSFVFQRFRAFKFLRVIGYHSLYIYLIHVMVTASIRVVVSKFLHVTNIPVLLLISIVFGITVPILMYNILVRNGFWWLFSLKKPVDEIRYHSGIALAKQ